MRTSLIGLIVILGSAMALAQAPKTFDVTSVKQVVVRPGVGFSCGFRWEGEEGGRALAGSFRTLMPVRCLISVAYEVPVLNIVGGPDWVDLDLFDVDGRSDGPATRTDTTAMLRTLLSARFGLLVRREPSFKAEKWVLRMARDDRRLGPGLRQAEMECIKTPENAPVSQRELRPGLPVPCGQRRDADIVAAGGVPFSSLLLPIQIAVGEEVIDRTGLTGLFDYYARLPRSATAGGGQQDAREASFFTALQEELGVRVEREEITREAIVIERVSRPSPN